MGQWDIRLLGDYEAKGYTFKIAASGMQKCIRRGKELEACQFAWLFYSSGYQRYLSRRLNIIVNEDVGLSNPTSLILAGVLEAKYNSKKDKLAPEEFNADNFLPFANLIMIACRGKKTRVGDNITNLIKDGIEKYGEFPQIIEDLYLDPHVPEGRAKWGRWGQGTKEENQKRVLMWFDHWAKLEDEETGSDPYRETLKQWWGYYGDVREAINE